jgi:hypothetical protein
VPESVIERIARVLWKCAYDDAGPVNQCYGATADEGWASYADDARRVIAAMGDPLDVMVDAGEMTADGKDQPSAAF